LRIKRGKHAPRGEQANKYTSHAGYNIFSKLGGEQNRATPQESDRRGSKGWADVRE
jgi:hypothetical protein